MHRILLIEDHQDTGDLIKTTLELEGHAVTWCQTFDSALDGCSSAERPCLVLMDLLVPGKTSPRDFIAGVKQKYPGVQIFILSGHPKSNGSANEYDVDGYVAKPFDLNELTQLIATKCKP